MTMLSPMAQVLSLADKRVGTDKLLVAAEEAGLEVTVQPAGGEMLRLARAESGAEDLCGSRGHSLYFIRRAQCPNVNETKET